MYAADLRTNIIDFRGFASSKILILRGGIHTPIFGQPFCHPFIQASFRKLDANVQDFNVQLKIHVYSKCNYNYSKSM